jgi:hypothetical protein
MLILCVVISVVTSFGLAEKEYWDRLGITLKS